MKIKYIEKGVIIRKHKYIYFIYMLLKIKENKSEKRIENHRRSTSIDTDRRTE